MKMSTWEINLITWGTNCGTWGMNLPVFGNEYELRGREKDILVPNVRTALWHGLLTMPQRRTEGLWF
jgi:hypothetical protein